MAIIQELQCLNKNKPTIYIVGTGVDGWFICEIKECLKNIGTGEYCALNSLTYQIYLKRNDMDVCELYAEIYPSAVLLVKYRTSLKDYEDTLQH